MKSIYVSPEIMYEDFSLSTNIASCEIRVNNSVVDVCPYIDNDFGVPIFTTDISGCDFPQEDSANNGFCYHSPIETNNLFNS